MAHRGAWLNVFGLHRDDAQGMGLRAAPPLRPRASPGAASAAPTSTSAIPVQRANRPHQAMSPQLPPGQREDVSPLPAERREPACPPAAMRRCPVQRDSAEDQCTTGCVPLPVRPPSEATPTCPPSEATPTHPVTGSAMQPTSWDYRPIRESPLAREPSQAAERRRSAFDCPATSGPVFRRGQGR